MNRTPAHRGDRGAVLILMALLLTTLMIFAALAVDIGAARSARRKAQGTVDSSALGGGQLLITETGTLTSVTANDVADQVIKITHENMTGDATMSEEGALSLPEWRNRFRDCTDPDRDATRFPVVSTASPCISFNTTISRVRVRMPDLHIGTNFAGIIGVDELTTSAFAEVDLIPSGSGGVLPFGLLAGATGPEVCLKTGSAPVLPPCNGPDTGNFGTLDYPFFGNPVIGTPEMCTGGGPLRLAVNIAAGIDHRLSEYVSGTPVDDRASCPDLALRPNQIAGRTGMVAQTLSDGLITGMDLAGHPIPGRLTNGPWTTRLAQRNSPPLDDRPLWMFLDPSLTTTDAPASCVGSITVIDSKAEMAQCLVDYVAASSYTAPIFSADIDGTSGVDLLRSPRLAWVPRFHESNWGPGASDPYRILRFEPVFLQTTYFACNSGTGGCAGIFDPGEIGSGLPVNNNRRAEALTALLLTPSMLPAAVIEPGPNGPVVHELVLRR